jgi:ABC-type transport system involved in cytochrome c biogenesis ATPase subunit
MLFEARNLAHSLHNGAHFLFQDLNFELRQVDGDEVKPILVIQGPSGVGKTTLLKKLACLTPGSEKCDLKLNARFPPG